MPEQEDSTVGVTGKPQFRFDAFGVRKACFQEVAIAPHEENEQKPPRVNVGLEVTTQIEAAVDQSKAIVTLQVQITPDPKWQPYRIEVTVAGVFSGENVEPAQFDQFCRLGVPAILFPYVREMTQRLTMDAPYGVVRIDPINITDLIARSGWGTVEPPAPTASNEP